MAKKKCIVKVKKNGPEHMLYLHYLECKNPLCSICRQWEQIRIKLKPIVQKNDE